MLTRSWAVRVLVAAALIANLVLAVGVSSAQPATTITFWHGYNPIETEVLHRDVIPAFEAQHPGIKVAAQQIPYDDLRKKLLASVAGGEAPDVLRADIAWVPEFADMGALLALDEAMPDFWDHAVKVFPGPLQTNAWNGRYYGLPLDTNTRVLIYHKMLYRLAGQEKVPATVEEFEAAMYRLKGLGEDVYGFADGGTYAWAIMPWIWSFGGDVADPSMTTAHGYINGPGAVAAVTKWKEWLDAGLLSPNLLGGGIGTSDGVGKNLYGNILDGPWMKPIFGQQFPYLDYDFAPMPAGPSGSISVVGGEDIVVFQSTRNRAAALSFVRFMLSEDVQLTLGQVGQMPVLNTLVGHPLLPQYYQVFMKQLETARARLPHPRWSKMDGAITEAVEKALRGVMTPQAALDEAAARIDVLLQGG